MSTVDPTPAELFEVSARVIKRFERECLQAGHAMDTIKGLTMQPLTVEQRRLVVEALIACEDFDRRRDVFAQLHNLGADIERGCGRYERLSRGNF